MNLVQKKALSLIFTIVIGGTVAWVYSSDRAESKREIQSLKSEIANLASSTDYANSVQKNLLTRADVAEGTINLLAKESKTIVLAQAKIKADATAQIGALSNNLKQTQSSQDLSAIIAEWRPYTAQIQCYFYTPTQKITTSASGMLFKTAAKPSAHLITNKHVIAYKDIKPDSCEITFPDISNKIKVSSTALLFAKDATDLGNIDISGKSTTTDALADLIAKKNICTGASTGDKVIILGYPSIGVKNDVTATEGIISGMDGNYYITSAKIEQGNSGGAAILVPKNGASCYLGIPTFVDVGQVESLARILSVTAF